MTADVIEQVASDLAMAGPPAPPTLDQIRRLQREMRSMQQTEMPPEHTFGPGFYCRTLRIPAGTIIVGKQHAKEHIFILTAGEMMVGTEDGMKHVAAPFQAVCRAGLKRVGYALTDCVGTNVHLTAETSLDRLELELIAPESETAIGADGAELIQESS